MFSWIWLCLLLFWTLFSLCVYVFCVFVYICVCNGEGNGTPLQHSCLENPRMEEPGRLQSMGSLRVRHDWATSLSLFPFMHWRRNWQPSPVILPGKSHGRRSLVGCSPWGHEESDTTERLHFHFSLLCNWRRKWQATPVFLPGESQGRGSLVGSSVCRTESDTTEVT